MARLYYIRKGEKSVKYGDKKPPMLRATKWKSAFFILFSITLIETLYIVWTKYPHLFN